MNQVMATLPLQFHNPFPGKPAPVELCNLFVVRPTTLIKLLGTSFSGIFAERGESALYKELKSPTPSASSLHRLLDLIPPDHPMSQQITQALNGDQRSIDSLTTQGEWKIFLGGMQADIHNLPNALLVNVENACRVPHSMVDQNKFRESARLLAEHDLMSMFFWDEALDHLASSNDKNDLLFMQGAIAMEVCLSHLAAVDAERSESDLPGAMPIIPNNGKNPSQLLFKWIKQQTGAQSISLLLADKRATKLKIDVTTLKRWSAGQYLPSSSLMENLIDAFFVGAVVEEARLNYFAAKYLNFIGYVSERCAAAASSSQGNIFPWPEYPFGYKSFEEWSSNRYQFWFDMHMTTRKRGLK